MSRDSLGRTGFGARQLQTDAAPAAMLLVLVALLAALVCGGPSLIRSFADEEVRQAASELSLADRSLTEQTTAGLPYVTDGGDGPVEQRWWGPLQERLAAVRAGFPEAVREVVGEARFLSRTTRVEVESSAGQRFQQFLQFDSDPFIAEHLQLERGRWPQVVAPLPNQLPALEVVVGAPAAQRLQWELGTTRTVDGRAVTLVGLLAEGPLDPEYLTIEPNALSALVFDDGNAAIRLTGIAFVADGAWDAGALTDGAGVAPGRLWFPVRADMIDAAGAPELIAQLRRITSTSIELDVDGLGGTGTVQLSTELPGALSAALRRADTAGSVQWVALSGPFGAAVAVLVLALQAFARRRADAMTLLVDRGAAAATLRAVAASQGALIGLPGAALGALGVATFAPWPVPWWTVLLGLAAGLVPVLYLSAVAAPSRRRGRTDLTSSGSRTRWVSELVVVALAVSAVTLLLTGSLDPPVGPTDPADDTTTGGADLLVVLAPILSILAVCVLTLRLYPVPLRLIRSITRRRRGLVAHLGVTRSLREPAVGLPLILACLTGVTVATFSVATQSTIDRGIADAASRAAGSDLTMTGAPTFPSVVELAATAPGVRNVATLGDAGLVDLVVDGARTRVELFFGDTAALARVIAEVPRAAAVPGGMAAPVADGAPTPIVVSTALGLPSGAVTSLNGEPAAVVATGDYLPQASARWILVDTAVLSTFVRDRSTGSVLLLDLAPGADPERTSAFLAREVPALEGVMVVDFDGVPTGALRFDTRVASEQRLTDVPTIAGMRVVLTVITVLSALLTVLAVLVLAVGASRQRSRLLAMLRLLGLRPRQAAALSAWEQGPPVITAVVVGGGFGLVLAVLVQHAVDLRAFTGDVLAPTFALDAGRLLLMAGGFAVAVIAAVAVSAMLSGRAAAGSVLRGEP